MKTAVIGATGFIGSNLCATMLERGWSVRGLIRPGTNQIALKGLEVEAVTGVIEDESALTALMRGTDLVFHAAAFNPKHSLSPRSHCQIAALEIAQVLSCFKRSKAARLVYTSALCAQVDRRSVASVVAVKGLMERAVRQAAATGVNAVVVTPSHCIGERDARPGSAGLLLALWRRALPAVVNGHFNAVDIQDVVRGHLEAALHAEAGEVRRVFGPDTTVRDFVNLCADELRVPRPPWTLPLALAYPAALLVELVSVPLGQIPKLRLEDLELIRLTHPLETSQGSCKSDVRAAVRRAFDWLKQHGYVP
jgi:dihydroflavonol-4-reductase